MTCDSDEKVHENSWRLAGVLPRIRNQPPVSGNHRRSRSTMRDDVQLALRERDSTQLMAPAQTCDEGMH